MTDVSGRKHAVILSGGGASGAYEVGVLKGLFAGDSPATNYTPLMPDIFAGTSIGAYNAALLVSEVGSKGPNAIEYLEHIWLDVMPRDDETAHNFILRYRGDPLQFLNPGYVFAHPLDDSIQLAKDSVFFAREIYRRGLNFFLTSGDIESRLLKLVDLSIIISNEPEYRLVKETINFENIYQSDKVLKIATTNWSTGDLRVFTNADLVGDIGPCAVLASTSLPGIFPQVEIQGDFYADGGVVMNTPLNLGIESGAEVLHVVYLDPDVKAIPLLPVRNTIDTFSRFFAIQFASTVNRDIEVAQRINKALGMLDRAASGGPVSEKDVGPFLVVARRLSETSELSKYKKLTIHRYQPRDTLKGILGLLNFDPDKSLDLMSKGFEDAIYHNCAANKCVLPE